MSDVALELYIVKQDCPNNTTPVGSNPIAAYSQLGMLFQSYIDSGSFKDALITLSAEGNLLQLNSSKDLLGYRAEEIILRSFFELVFPEDIDQFTSFLQKTKSDSSIECFTHRAVKKNGSICQLKWHALSCENGQLIAICEEFTLQQETTGIGKKATEQILQALLDNSFDMLALIDDQGNYVYVSESFYDNFEYQPKTTLGYKAMDIVGTNCFSYMHPDDLPRIKNEFESLFSPEKKVYSPPFRFKSASGEWRWVEAVVTNQLSNPDIEAIVVSCRDVTQQVDTEQQLKEMQLWEALVNGEEKERSRIARDLHDGVAGMLAAAKMHLASLKATEKQIGTMDAFGQAIRLVEEAAVEVRKTSHNLMPEILLQHGLDEALRRYCCTISNSNSLVVQYDSWGDLMRYKSSFELSVYRIVQELLNNILKHAGATEAMVQLSQQDSVLSLFVEDNGKGFDSAVILQGHGLSSIKRRVEAMNSRLEIVSEPGRGTSVYLEFRIQGAKP